MGWVVMSGSPLSMYREAQKRPFQLYTIIHLSVHKTSGHVFEDNFAKAGKPALGRASIR